MDVHDLITHLTDGDMEAISVAELIVLVSAGLKGTHGTVGMDAANAVIPLTPKPCQGTIIVNALDGIGGTSSAFLEWAVKLPQLLLMVVVEEDMSLNLERVVCFDEEGHGLTPQLKRHPDLGP
jgi:hypothetical protein